MAVDVPLTAAAGSGIKPIRQLLDTHAFIPSQVVDLARWTAEYYAAGAGEMITAVLPPKARGDRVSGHRTIRVAAITVAGLEAIVARGGQVGLERQAGLDGTDVHAAIGITTKQREILERLADVRDGIAATQLGASGISSDSLNRLASRGLITLRNDR